MDEHGLQTLQSGRNDYSVTDWLIKLKMKVIPVIPEPQSFIKIPREVFANLCHKGQIGIPVLELCKGALPYLFQWLPSKVRLSCQTCLWDSSKLRATCPYVIKKNALIFFLISWPFFSQTVSYFPSCQTARNHFCLTNSSSTEPYPNLGVTIRCKWEPGHRHRILYESEGSGGAKALTVTPIFLSQTSFCNFLVQFSAIMRSLQTQPWNSKWPTLKINWLKKKKKGSWMENVQRWFSCEKNCSHL